MGKIKNQLQVSVSGFVDEGDGVVSFPNGLTITDDTVMRSGTRYDIESLDIDNYQGQLTADHIDSLETLIGKVSGVVKEGNRIAIKSIKYAVNSSAKARLAYDLLREGISNSFSIETIGPYPDSADPVFRSHELVGLSQVVVPNNYNAKVNQFNEIVHNSLERSQQDGLDISGIESEIYSSVELKSSEAIKEEDMTKKEELNASEKLEEVKTEEAVVENDAAETEVAEDEAKLDEEAKVEAEEESETESEEESEDEVEEEKESEDESEQDEDEDQADDEETEESEDEESDDTEESEEEAKQENQTNKNEEKLEMTAEQIAEIVANAVKAEVGSLKEDMAAAKELAQNAFDAQAKEPEFKTVAAADTKEENGYEGLSADELFSKQLNAAVAVERLGSVEARQTLHDINALNLQSLKDEKIVNAALTLEDLGNFVIAPELFKEIEGVRTDYTAILNATQWKETKSLEFAWLTRTQDINMSNVAIGALGDVYSPDTIDGTDETKQSDKRLKPISMPGYGTNSDKLEEMAAVTPISINVIKFAAVDILSDVAEGYRNDYDRKRAQLVIARLQQAVNLTGNRQNYDVSEGLDVWALVVSKLSDVTTVGTLLFNNKTLALLKSQAIKSQNTAILAEVASGSILGTPFIVVPNDLMPTLNTTETRTFEVQGSPVTIDTAVFYGDYRTFTGRTSGGLKYDVDGSASYEIDGTVYSAYQRNEIVLRGSFFRGGVVKDPTMIAGIPAIAVS